MHGCHMRAVVGNFLRFFDLIKPYHIALLYVCSFLEKKAAACKMACKKSSLLCTENDDKTNLLITRRLRYISLNDRRLSNNGRQEHGEARHGIVLHTIACCQQQWWISAVV